MLALRVPAERLRMSRDSQWTWREPHEPAYIVAATATYDGGQITITGHTLSDSLSEDNQCHPTMRRK